MSEYWVSKKKYYCKYCDTYIADDIPSRQHHENGMRHKGSVERFIRGLYKTSEKQKKDADEEKRDMARVELAAQAAFAQDVAAGLAKPSSAPVASTSTAARKPMPKPSNPYANYSTAESLGFQDPDAERYAAETERRRTQGLAGDWEVVSTLPTAPASDATETNPDGGGSLKREAETPVDEEDTRQFKLRKRTLNVGLGEVYDPGVIPIKLKQKEEPEPETSLAPVESANSASAATSVPKWTKVQWKRPGDVVKTEEESSSEVANGDETLVKAEKLPINGEEPTSVINETSLVAAPPEDMKPSIPKLEEASPPLSTPEAAGSLFRKRKMPAGGNRGKRPT